MPPGAAELGEALACQLDDRAALGGLVADRRHERGGDGIRSSTPGAGTIAGCQPVAVGDRAGLVEEDDVHVAGGLDGAAAHGQHVEASDAVHAGDADGRQEPADRGGDEADEQGDELDRADGLAGEEPERAQRDDGQQEHEASGRRAGWRGRSRWAMRWRLAPSTRAIIRSRNVSPGSAVTRTTMLVAHERGAAGHGAADVGARLLEHRRGLAGDGGLVDEAHALDDVAVARDGLALLDHDDVALAQLRRADVLERAVVAAPMSRRHRARPPQRGRLGSAAGLGDRLGVGREEDGEPEPQRRSGPGSRGPRAPVTGWMPVTLASAMSVTSTAVISTTNMTGLRTMQSRVELAERLRDGRAEELADRARHGAAAAPRTASRPRG